ncbi:TENA/THI-4/PQQC family domain-containing protein [Ditylenchus destructor]|uniref:TENA/THI-4/PQQC family domain-containing protein n=1 Tax=Ditylenchus destructor TaxID=166010 RepID=A0AAD4MJA4_9BILA|nr:TENA/THI-4/PQQC family domain-containing protein [Ditylenchus destructor]
MSGDGGLRKNSQCNNPEILESTWKLAQVETAHSRTFSKEAGERNEDEYQQIRQLPYHQEMARGDLKLEVFQHYLIQDAHYLKRCAESMNILANGVKNDHDKAYFKNRHESWTKHHEDMLLVTFPKYKLTRANFDDSVISGEFNFQALKY